MCKTSRALVPPRLKYVPLRMMNLRDVVVRLHKGTTVAELQPVDVVEMNAPPPKEDPQDQKCKYGGCISVLCVSVN